jgi:hypothetical protein
MRTTERDLTMLIVAFGNFANGSESNRYSLYTSVIHFDLIRSSDEQKYIKEGQVSRTTYIVPLN